MILEGFEIENWSCIKKVRVTGLPASGVVVICGPNRRGKSSIVQALRACLMDNSSTSTALKSWYPRGTGEKPSVSVQFRVGGHSYRIRKHFGSSKSDFAKKTAAGEWKVETTSAADAHERTCALAGGNDSAKGLHQLLWLTQAEFRLPEAKKFDADVQARLRGILGVLQTPLDDRFIERVKKRWNVWYSGQRKARKQQEIKEGCALAENLRRLEEARKELADTEQRFGEVEGLLRQAADLKQTIANLNGQLELQTRQRDERREEHRQCQARLLARQQAEKEHADALKEQAVAGDEQRQREDTVRRCQTDEESTGPARVKVEAAGQRIGELERRQQGRRDQVQQLAEERRQVQQRATQVARRLAEAAEAGRLAQAQAALADAEELGSEINRIEANLAANPAPDAKQLAELKENRQQVARLQADLNAAAMQLVIATEPVSRAAQLVVDAGAKQEVPAAASDTYSVWRKAELVIEGWGRATLRRGSGENDIDEIENEWRRLEEAFTSATAGFGVVGGDSGVLDQLIERVHEHRVRRAALDERKKSLKKLAPGGLESLRASVQAWQRKVDAGAAPQSEQERLPKLAEELEALRAKLEDELSDLDRRAKNLETGGIALESELRAARQEELAAKEALAGCMARAGASRDELGRLRSAEQIVERVKAAEQAVASSVARLQATQLTPSELTIDDRLEAAEQAVRALDKQLREGAEKFNIIKGRLIDCEGLHARRSAAAARVEELTRLTESESLERQAVDRLYELFEECREKQLGSLMGPIHDRVLGWMRVLDIGDYQQVRFNDAFLPEKLTSRGETAEFEVSEESTGAQEQIGMLVRLALGSVLASASEPAVAILDDPLTHCDIGRLSRMRGILRQAAEGDASLTPPAGPLQIVIFTCHPEWFRDEKAMVIDLEDGAVMSRLAV